MTNEPSQQEPIHDVPPCMRCEQCRVRRGVTDERGPWLCEGCATMTGDGGEDR